MRKRQAYSCTQLTFVLFKKITRFSWSINRKCIFRFSRHKKQKKNKIDKRKYKEKIIHKTIFRLNLFRNHSQLISAEYAWSAEGKTVCTVQIRRHTTKLVAWSIIYFQLSSSAEQNNRNKISTIKPMDDGIWLKKCKKTDVEKRIITESSEVKINFGLQTDLNRILCDELNNNRVCSSCNWVFGSFL